MAQAKRKDKAKKRVVVVEPVGEVHIRASFNNIIINSFSDVISCSLVSLHDFLCLKYPLSYLYFLPHSHM